MGLSSKQVSGDHHHHLELNWTRTMLACAAGSEGLDLELPKPRSSTKRQLQTPQSDPLKCPRCESTNTKFCYYNNYNKTQPRHFCKACKRHWTKGGTLRNVPIGGGRKNKRNKRPTTTATATATTTTTLNPISLRNIRPLGFGDHKDAFGDHKDTLSDTLKVSFFKPIDNEGRNVLESYTDNIEELKGQISWDFNGNFTSCEPQFPHQNIGFSMHDTNPNPTAPSSFPSLTAYNGDSTVTTTRMIMPSSSSSQPWQVPSTSNFLESNYWNWNDIDDMVSTDLNKTYEDTQFKP